MTRLDKFLAETLAAKSRRDAADMIKLGRVIVNGAAALRPDDKIDESSDAVTVDGQAIRYSRFNYIMMDKPIDVLTATEDNRRKTVLDLLPEKYRRLSLGPIGRLDADVTGLVILTDDGELVHKLISPKNHVPKVYVARTERPSTPADARRFRAGLKLSDFKAMPAELSYDADTGESTVTVYEGKYHQVKRMFLACGNDVLSLRRVRLAGIEMDDALGAGGWRFLTADEQQLLLSAAENN